MIIALLLPGFWRLALVRSVIVDICMFMHICVCILQMTRQRTNATHKDSKLCFMYAYLHACAELEQFADSPQAKIQISHSHQHGYKQPASPWLTWNTFWRFGVIQCVERSSWQNISRDFRDSRLRFKSGFLGKHATQDYKAWGCWKGHSCLQHASYSSQETMCFVYHEQVKKWHPWTLMQEMKECSAGR